MVLLISFDLPRKTKLQQKEAAVFRKRLISLGFTMKQFSLYERRVRKNETAQKLVREVNRYLPCEGQVIAYELPDYVHNNQKVILGDEAICKSDSKPKFIIL